MLLLLLIKKCFTSPSNKMNAENKLGWETELRFPNLFLCTEMSCSPIYSCFLNCIVKTMKQIVIVQLKKKKVRIYKKNRNFLLSTALTLNELTNIVYFTAVGGITFLKTSHNIFKKSICIEY